MCLQATVEIEADATKLAPKIVGCRRLLNTDTCGACLHKRILCTRVFASYKEPLCSTMSSVVKCGVSSVGLLMQGM